MGRRTIVATLAAALLLAAAAPPTAGAPADGPPRCDVATLWPGPGPGPGQPADRSPDPEPAAEPSPPPPPSIPDLAAVLDRSPLLLVGPSLLGTTRPGLAGPAVGTLVQLASSTAATAATVTPAPSAPLPPEPEPEPEPIVADPWPSPSPATCARAEAEGLTEVRAGIFVGRAGPTVTVVADRALVDLAAVDGSRTFATRIEGDVAVNANWFTAAGSEGPIVVDGTNSGSADTIERGQIVVVDAACGAGPTGALLEHRWTGEIYTPDGCARHAVSGVSLVHQGRRADEFPGIDLTSGYTNVNRSHSFLGFDGSSIFVIASTDLNASQLADRALALGATEGVMLDGGGSTQISTPTETIVSTRPVTAFAVLDSRT